VRGELVLWAASQQSFLFLTSNISLINSKKLWATLERLRLQIAAPLEEGIVHDLH
jgi:hypothetical protein